MSIRGAVELVVSPKSFAFELLRTYCARPWSVTQSRVAFFIFGGSAYSSDVGTGHSPQSSAMETVLVMERESDHFRSNLF